MKQWTITIAGALLFSQFRVAQGCESGWRNGTRAAGRITGSCHGLARRNPRQSQGWGGASL